MSLLNCLSVFLRLELASAVFINWLVIMDELVLPFYDKSLVHQSLEIRKVKHAERASEVLVESSKESVYLPFFGGHIIKRITSQVIELV